MKIIKGFNADALRKIAKATGNKQIIKDVGYTGLIAYRNPEKVYCERLDDIAFFTGYHNSDHFRIIGIGVRKDQQGKGYGKFMLYRAINYARNAGHKKIKTRTLNGVDFYQKMCGAKIVGMVEEDFLMEIDI